LVFVGIDWAEKHHDICIIDQEGAILARGRVADGVEGISKLHEMVADHIEEPEQAIVGIELDRGLLVGALVAAGYEVFAINPLSVDRYRDRPRPRERNRTPVTPRCSPTSCAPTVTTTARSPGIPSSPKRSNCLPGHIRASCGNASVTSIDCAATCASSTRKRSRPSAPPSLASLEEEPTRVT